MNDRIPPTMPGSGDSWSDLGALDIRRTPPPAQHFSPHWMVWLFVLLCSGVATLAKLNLFGLTLAFERGEAIGEALASGLAVLIVAWIAGRVVFRIGGEVGSSATTCIVAILMALGSLASGGDDERFDRDLVMAFSKTASGMDASIERAAALGPVARSQEQQQFMLSLDQMHGRQSEPKRSQRVDAARVILRGSYEQKLRFLVALKDVLDAQQRLPAGVADEVFAAELQAKLEELKQSGMESTSARKRTWDGMLQFLDPGNGRASKAMLGVLSAPGFAELGLEQDKFAIAAVDFADSELRLLAFMREHRRDWQTTPQGQVAFERAKPLAEYQDRAREVDEARREFQEASERYMQVENRLRASQAGQKAAG